MNIVVWSYLTAALAFLLTAFWAPKGLPRRLAVSTLLAMGVSAVWALLFAGLGTGEPMSGALAASPLMMPATVVRYGALLVLLDLLNGGANRNLRRLNAALWCVALVLALAGTLVPSAGKASSLAGLVLAFAGMVNVEQLLRNATPRFAQAIKFCVLGLGGQIAYDLFLYSQAQLLGGIDMTGWALRGFVFAALTPFAAIGFRRLAHEQSALFVSRQVVFYTTAFLSIGVYLVAMALGGYYVRAHGGSWGEALRLAFFVGAGLVLAALMLSPTLWRRWRVFVAKHFYRNKYDYRAEWLRFIDTLSASEQTDAGAVSIRAIAQIIESPGGLLFLRAEGAIRFEPVASWFLRESRRPEVAGIEVSHELPRFMTERQWVVDLREYRSQPGIYRNIGLPEWLLDERSGWRIVTPLLQLDKLIGFLVLKAPPEPFQMTFEDRDLLRTVGRHVATLLEQQAADRKLAEGRQFDAFHRFAAFVMHDLKNSVAQLQLLVTNASRHRGNPQFMDDAVETIGNTVARMRRLIEQLQSRETESVIREVELVHLVRGAVQRCGSRTPEVEFVSSVTDATVRADPERLSSVLEHVVRNAQEAAGSDGNVTVKLELDGPSVSIAVCDDGPGMDDEFIRNRLFRPFESTKGSKGMGIGAYQAREYVGQLGGHIEVQSSTGSGTTFFIRLSLCQTPVPTS